MADYDDLTLEELRDACRERDLKTSGNKDELVARLELDDLEVDEDEAEAADSTPVDDVAPDEPAGAANVAGEVLTDQEEIEEPNEPPEPSPWSRSARGGERREPPEVEGEAVASVRTTVAQEGVEVKGAFQFAVLPDGRRVPVQGARDEGDDEE